MNQDIQLDELKKILKMPASETQQAELKTLMKVQDPFTIERLIRVNSRKVLRSLNMLRALNSNLQFIQNNFQTYLNVSKSFSKQVSFKHFQNQNNVDFADLKLNEQQKIQDLINNQSNFLKLFSSFNDLVQKLLIEQKKGVETQSQVRVVYVNQERFSVSMQEGGAERAQDVADLNILLTIQRIQQDKGLNVNCLLENLKVLEQVYDFDDIIKSSYKGYTFYTLYFLAYVLLSTSRIKSFQLLDDFTSQLSEYFYFSRDLILDQELSEFMKEAYRIVFQNMYENFIVMNKQEKIDMHTVLNMVTRLLNLIKYEPVQQTFFASPFAIVLREQKEQSCTYEKIIENINNNQNFSVIFTTQIQDLQSCNLKEENFQEMMKQLGLNTNTDSCVIIKNLSREYELCDKAIQIIIYQNLSLTNLEYLENENVINLIANNQLIFLNNISKMQVDERYSNDKSSLLNMIKTINSFIAKSQTLQNHSFIMNLTTINNFKQNKNKYILNQCVDYNFQIDGSHGQTISKIDHRFASNFSPVLFQAIFNDIFSHEPSNSKIKQYELNIDILSTITYFDNLYHPEDSGFDFRIIYETYNCIYSGTVQNLQIKHSNPSNIRTHIKYKSVRNLTNDGSNMQEINLQEFLQIVKNQEFIVRCTKPELINDNKSPNPDQVDRYLRKTELQLDKLAEVKLDQNPISPIGQEAMLFLESPTTPNFDGLQTELIHMLVGETARMSAALLRLLKRLPILNLFRKEKALVRGKTDLWQVEAQIAKLNQFLLQRRTNESEADSTNREYINYTTVLNMIIELVYIEECKATHANGQRASQDQAAFTRVDLTLNVLVKLYELSILLAKKYLPLFLLIKPRLTKAIQLLKPEYSISYQYIQIKVLISYLIWERKLNKYQRLTMISLLMEQQQEFRLLLEFSEVQDVLNPYQVTLMTHEIAVFEQTIDAFNTSLLKKFRESNDTMTSVDYLAILDKYYNFNIVPDQTPDWQAYLMEIKKKMEERSILPYIMWYYKERLTDFYSSNQLPYCLSKYIRDYIRHRVHISDYYFGGMSQDTSNTFNNLRALLMSIQWSFYEFETDTKTQQVIKQISKAMMQLNFILRHMNQPLLDKNFIQDTYFLEQPSHIQEQIKQFNSLYQILFHPLTNKHSNLILQQISQVHSEYFFKIKHVKDSCQKLYLMTVKSEDVRKDKLVDCLEEMFEKLVNWVKSHIPDYIRLFQQVNSQSLVACIDQRFLYFKLKYLIVQIPNVLSHDKESQHVIDNANPKREITHISRRLYALTFERSLESPKHSVILKIIFKSIITLCNYSSDEKIKFEDFVLCSSDSISFASQLYNNDSVEFANIVLKINNNFSEQIEMSIESKSKIFNLLQDYFSSQNLYQNSIDNSDVFTGQNIKFKRLQDQIACNSRNQKLNKNQMKTLTLSHSDNQTIMLIIQSICSQHNSKRSDLVDISIFDDNSTKDEHQGEEGAMEPSIFTNIYYLLLESLFDKRSTKCDHFKTYIDKMYKMTDQFKQEDYNQLQVYGNILAFLQMDKFLQKKQASTFTCFSDKIDMFNNHFKKVIQITAKQHEKGFYILIPILTSLQEQQNMDFTEIQNQLTIQGTSTRVSPGVFAKMSELELSSKDGEQVDSIIGHQQRLWRVSEECSGTLCSSLVGSRNSLVEDRIYFCLRYLQRDDWAQIQGSSEVGRIIACIKPSIFKELRSHRQGDKELQRLISILQKEHQWTNQIKIDNFNNSKQEFHSISLLKDAVDKMIPLIGDLMMKNNVMLIRLFPIFVSVTVGLINLMRAQCDTLKEQVSKLREDMQHQFNSSREVAMQLIQEASSFFKSQAIDSKGKFTRLPVWTVNMYYDILIDHLAIKEKSVYDHLLKQVGYAYEIAPKRNIWYLWQFFNTKIYSEKGSAEFKQKLFYFYNLKLRNLNLEEVKSDFVKQLKQKGKKIFDKQWEKLQALTQVLGAVEQNRQFNDLHTNINKKVLKFEECLSLPVTEAMDVRISEYLLKSDKVDFDQDGLPCTYSLTSLDFTQTITWQHSKDKPFNVQFGYSNSGKVEQKNFVVKRLSCYKDNFISRQQQQFNRMFVIEGCTQVANDGFLHNFVPTVQVASLLVDNTARQGNLANIVMLEFFGPSRNISDMGKECTKTIPDYEHKKNDNKQLSKSEKAKLETIQAIRPHALDFVTSTYYSKVAQCFEINSRRHLFTWPPVLNRAWDLLQGQNKLDNKSNLVVTQNAYSLFGQFLGMGDRHASNLLLHSSDSRVCHIDFDAISEMGQLMPVKEIMPIRLTPNTVALLDFEGCTGLIATVLTRVMQVVRENQTFILPLVQVTCDNQLEGLELGRAEFGLAVQDHVDQLRSKMVRNMNGRLWACMTDSGNPDEMISDVEQFVQNLTLNCADLGRNLQMFSGWSCDL